jgi:hypothetical protein
MAEELVLKLAVDKSGAIAVTDLTGKMRKFDTATKTANIGLKNLSAALRSTVIVTGINQAISAMRQLAAAAQWVGRQVEEGVAANRIAAQFELFAAASGQSANEMRTAMQAATGYEVTLTDLEATANRVAMVTGDAANATAVLGFAFQAAAATGQKTVAVAQTITQALATGRTQAIRQYGIIIDQSMAYMDAAKSAGVEVEWLTETEKKRAVNIQILAQMEMRLAGMVDRTGNSYMKLKTEMLDLQSSMQQWMAGGAPTGMEGTVFQEAFDAETISAGLEAYTKGLGQLAEVEAKLKDAANQAAKDARVEVDSYVVISDQAVHIAGRQTAAMERARVLQEEYNKSAAAGSLLAQRIAEGSSETVAALEVAAKNAGKINYSTIFAAGADALDSALEMTGVRIETARTQLEALTKARDVLESKESVTDAEAKALQDLRYQIASVTMSLGSLESASSTASSAQDLMATATVAMVGQLRDEADKYRALEGPMSTRAKQLDEQRKFVEQLVAEQLKLSAWLAETGESEAIDMASILGLDDGSTVAIASAFEDLKLAKADLDKALTSGDVEDASRALGEYWFQAMNATQTMRDMGVAEEDVSQANADLSRSLSGYTDRIAIATTGTYGAAKALRDLEAASFDAFLEFEKTLKEMGGAAWDPKSADAKPTKRSGGASRKDITQKELDLELAILKAGEGTIEAAELQHQLRMYRAKETAHLKTRELALESVRAQMDYATAVQKIEADAQAKSAKAFDEEVQRRQGTVDAATAATADWIKANRTIYEMQVRHLQMTGEVTGAEAEQALARNALLDDTLSANDRLIAQQRLMNADEVVVAEGLDKTARAWADVGRAATSALSDMQQLSNIFGESGLSAGMQYSLSQIEGLAKGLGELATAGGDQKQLASGIASASTAMGKAFAPLAGSAGKAALIMGAIALGNALMFQLLNPAMAATQWAAVAQYGLVAALTGFGGGSAKAKPARSLGTSAPTSQSGGSSNYTFIFNGGYAVDTKEEISGRIIDTINGGRYTGKRIAKELL